MVKSWGDCNSASLIWDDLNANWSAYGSIPISINYSDPALCGSSFTYDALVANGADIVIISDPLGGNSAYSPGEIEALRQYAMDGHNVIGTFLAFGYIPGQGNRDLALLFGLTRQITYTRGDREIDPVYRLRAPDIALFRNVPNPYTSSGYPFTQSPEDGRWDTNELAGATYAAAIRGNRAVISLFRTPTYDGIYISSMPEYNGTAADKQFFYNAIIWPAEG